MAVRMAIAEGADVEACVAGVGTNGNVWTPLSTAAHYGHTELVRALVEAGADVNKADTYGSTP
eukprot:819550-Prorocentrum_minimum.AAC.1